jgi:hypothetical protein
VTKRNGSSLDSTAYGTDRGAANVQPSVEPLTVRPRAAAIVIGVGHSKLWELIRDGELKVSRIGRVTLVHVDSIRALIARTTAN